MPDTSLPVAAGPRTDILDSNQEGWARAEASDLEERMKTAVYLVACGSSYREAAKAVGYEDHASVYRATRRYGISSATSERIIERCRRVADLSLEELERRLTEDPSQFSAKELGVVGGIATDKLAKKERWGLSHDELAPGVSPLMKLCKLAAEGKLDLSIKVKTAPTTPEELARLGEGKVLEGEVVESDEV